MTPTSWTTEEQHIFLQGWLSQYQQHVGQKDFHQFWPLLFTTWFEKWSEREILFPGVQDPLSAKQTEELGAAVGARQKQLRTWFRWHTNGSRQCRVQQKHTLVFDATIEPKGSRILSQSEIYSAEYYDERTYVVAARTASQLNSCGEVLHAAHRLSKDLLEGEDVKIKERVKEIYEVQKKKSRTGKNDSAGATDPTEIQRAIDDLPYALACVAQLIKDRTRFAVSFICAGPDPSRNWEITSMSCHPDETPQDSTFAMLFPKEENAMLAAFQNYAEALFPPESQDPAHITNDASGADKCEVGDSMETDVPSAHDGGKEVNVGTSQDSVAGDEEENDIDEGTGDGQHEDESEGENGKEWENTGDASCLPADIVASSCNAVMSLAMDPAVATSSVAISATRSTLVPDASLTLPTIKGLQISSFENPPFYFDPSLSNTQLAPPTIASLMLQPVQSLAPVGGLAQSVMPFSSAADYVNQNSSFGANASITVDPISFSDAMASINTDLAGCGWNFSGIGVAGFGQTISTSDDPPLPTLPPTPKNLSPDRPCLPAIPLPSPLVHDPDDTLPNASKITKTRSRTKSKRNTAPIGQTTVPMAPKPPKRTGANIGTRRSEKETVAINPSMQVTTVEAWQELVATIVLPMDVPASGMVVNIPPASTQPAWQELVATIVPPMDVPALGMAVNVPPPSTQPHPGSSSAPSPHASKRIPIQSKRNAVANAIGTNPSWHWQRQNFVGSASNVQDTVPSTKQKMKRAEETTEGTAKKKRKAT